MRILLSNKTNLQKYQSPDKPVFLRDSKLQGFAVKLNPSGLHKFIVEFKRKGRSKRITIGSTTVFTVQDAREQARLVLSSADTVLQEVSPEFRTVGELLDEYLNNKKLSQRSIYNYSKIFNYFPYRSIHIQKITSTKVKHWYKKHSNIPTTIDQMYRQLKAIFNYAVQMEYIQTNPFNIPKGIRYKSNIKENYLEPKEQLPRFWKTLNKSESVTRDILKMYLLTGMRRNEIYKAELKDGLIIIPNTKNGSDHYIPVIPVMPLHLFNIDRDKWTKDCRKTIVRICNDADVPVVSIHDLRRTVASLCAYLGIDLGSIKHLLNHSVKGDVTLSHYIQYRADYLLPVMQKIDLYYKSIS